MHFLLPLLSVLAISFGSSHVRASGFHKRAVAFTDLCANVDGEIGLDIARIKLDLCICISALPALISTNLQLKAAAQLLGTSTVTADVTALIHAAVDTQECTFPEYAVPHCNFDNPCNFTCTNGFTPEPRENPTTCVCEGTICNGICGSSPCSSQRAKRGHRRHTICPHGWSVCGIRGRPNIDYECVDVRRDLWSCGGCEIPLLQTHPAGIDCTAIPGVLDVLCLANQCVVQRCKEGFDVSPNRTTCVPILSPRIPDDPVLA